MYTIENVDNLQCTLGGKCPLWIFDAWKESKESHPCDIEIHYDWDWWTAPMPASGPDLEPAGTARRVDGIMTKYTTPVTCGVSIQICSQRSSSKLRDAQQ